MMSNPAARRPRLLFYALILAASIASAEEPHAPSDVSAEPTTAFLPVSPLPLPTPIAPLTQAPDPVLQPVSKRLFGIIPNYRADQFQANYQPLSVREKFAIAHSDSFDWPNYFLLVGYALQSQVAAGGFTHNGGFKGFGEAYSRSVGDQIIGAYVTEAILPTLLHEDPRFFRLGAGTVRHRAYNAAVRIFVVQKDNGRTGFNLSEVVGNAGVAALATIYYPNLRTAPESLERYSMALGNDMLSNLLTEFWPDIRRHLPFRHPGLSDCFKHVL
jgi:hypothetical protein